MESFENFKESKEMSKKILKLLKKYNVSHALYILKICQSDLRDLSSKVKVGDLDF